MHFPSPYQIITRQLASLGVKPRYVTGLDSATIGLRALAKYLHGKDLPTGGIAPSAKALGADAVSHLPKQLFENLTTLSGWMSASSPRVVDARYPIPEPLKLHQLDTFLAQAGDRYSVRWIEHPVA